MQAGGAAQRSGMPHISIGNRTCGAGAVREGEGKREGRAGQ